jgi:type IV pilus assembly protein PilN
MLRINLLPVRQLKKRAKAKNQLLGILTGLLCLLALCFLVGFLQAKKIAAINTNIAELTSERDSFAPVLAKIEQHKKTKLELERKSAVIDKLKTDSSLTVRVLDEVASKVDNDRMWLDSLNQQGNSLQLTGVSLDNESVAQFMDNLKLSPFVREVELTDSSQKILSGRDLKSFSLSCSVAPPGTELASAPTNTTAKK